MIGVPASLTLGAAVSNAEDDGGAIRDSAFDPLTRHFVTSTAVVERCRLPKGSNAWLPGTWNAFCHRLIRWGQLECWTQGAQPSDASRPGAGAAPRSTEQCVDIMMVLAPDAVGTNLCNCLYMRRPITMAAPAHHSRAHAAMPIVSSCNFLSCFTAHNNAAHYRAQ